MMSGWGRLINSKRSGSGASSDGNTTSASATSSRTPACQSNEPLVSTATGTAVMAWMCSMISPRRECNVGSPEPLNVM